MNIRKDYVPVVMSMKRPEYEYRSGRLKIEYGIVCALQTLTLTTCSFLPILKENRMMNHAQKQT